MQRFVAFVSSASNLVAGDTNGVADVFVRDRDTDRDGIFDEAGAVATVVVHVLEDVAPFAGLDRNYTLHRDDIVTLPPSFAELLAKRGKVRVLAGV